MQYLVKKPDHDHWQGREYNIVQRLKPVIVEPLTRKSSLKGEPKLSQGECKIFVKEICDNLQVAIRFGQAHNTHVDANISKYTGNSYLA